MIIIVTNLLKIKTTKIDLILAELIKIFTKKIKLEHQMYKLVMTTAQEYRNFQMENKQIQEQNQKNLVVEGFESGDELNSQKN